MSLPKNLLQLFSATAMCIGLNACSPSEPAKPVKGVAKISAADIGHRIEQLSSDEFAGREPGTKGGQMASQYIADEMKAAGIAPMGKDGTYFQPITLTRTTVADGSFMEIGKQAQKPPNTNSKKTQFIGQNATKIR